LASNKNGRWTLLDKGKESSGTGHHRTPSIADNEGPSKGLVQSQTISISLGEFKEGCLLWIRVGAGSCVLEICILASP
jgi:hypothetical protein